MMELHPLEAGATFSPPSDPIVVNDDHHFEATPTINDSTVAKASGHSQTSADESMEELKQRLTSAHKKNRLLEDNAKQFQEVQLYAPLLFKVRSKRWQNPSFYKQMLSSTHELVSKYTDLVDKHNRTGLQLQQLTYENQRLKTEHQQTQQNVSQRNSFLLPFKCTSPPPSLPSCHWVFCNIIGLHYSI